MISRGQLRKGFLADRTAYKLEGRVSVPQITQLPMWHVKPVVPVSHPLCGLREPTAMVSGLGS